MLSINSLRSRASNSDRCCPRKTFRLSKEKNPKSTPLRQVQVVPNSEPNVAGHSTSRLCLLNGRLHASLLVSPRSISARIVAPEPTHGIGEDRGGMRRAMCALAEGELIIVRLLIERSGHRLVRFGPDPPFGTHHVVLTAL